MRFESEEKQEPGLVEVPEEQAQTETTQAPDLQIEEALPKQVDKWDQEREKELEMERRMKERREQLKQGKVSECLLFNYCSFVQFFLSLLHQKN